MAITVTRRNSWIYSLPIRNIRINDDYRASISNKERISLELPEQEAILSLNWINFPKVIVSDGDQVLIKDNAYSLIIFVTLLINLIINVIALAKSYNLPYSTLSMSILVLLNAFVPQYRLVKISGQGRASEE